MNRAILNVSLGAVLLLLGACGGSETDGASQLVTTDPPPLTAATLGQQTVGSATAYLAQDMYASADTKRGETLSMQCRACHSLEEGGTTLVGPNLYGIFGRRAGTGPDFSYSEALQAADFVWTPRALDAWLTEPFRFLTGNRMTFAGLPEQRDRNAVIAYLLKHTGTEDDNGTANSTRQ